MAGRQAKTIAPVQLDALLQHVRGRRDGLRSRVIILLSLRAGEIAKLEWRMVTDPHGKVSHTIELEDRITKKRSSRRSAPGYRVRHAPVCPIQPGQNLPRMAA